MKRFIKYWLPVAVWAGFIFFVSSLPNADIPSIFTYQDVLFHIFEYAFLALLLNRALKNYQSSLFNKSRRILFVILTCLIYAISDEIHQNFVPGRESSLADIIFDGLGIVLGSMIYPALSPKWRKITARKGGINR